jgi:hypothetical protein
MTNEQITQWAREAGGAKYVNRHYPDRPTFGFMGEQLQAFATLVRNATLEEAADVVENANTPDCGGWTASHIAEDIRSMK